jgi:hypothetical protein
MPQAQGITSRGKLGAPFHLSRLPLDVDFVLPLCPCSHRLFLTGLRAFHASSPNFTYPAAIATSFVMLYPAPYLNSYPE